MVRNCYSMCLAIFDTLVHNYYITCIRAIVATGGELGYFHSPFVVRWQTKACRQRKSDVEHHGYLFGHRGRHHLHKQIV